MEALDYVYRLPYLCNCVINWCLCIYVMINEKKNVMGTIVTWVTSRTKPFYNFLSFDTENSPFACK